MLITTLQLNAPQIITAMTRGLGYKTEGTFGVFDPKAHVPWGMPHLPVFTGSLDEAVREALRLSTEAKKAGKYRGYDVEPYPMRYHVGFWLLALDVMRVEIDILDPARYRR